MQESHKSNQADIVSIPSKSNIKNLTEKEPLENDTKTLKRIQIDEKCSPMKQTRISLTERQVQLIGAEKENVGKWQGPISNEVLKKFEATNK